MGTDFYWDNPPTGVCVASLDDRDFAKLEKATDAMKAKTGLTIDPYADGRISSDHARILLDNLGTFEGSQYPELWKFKAMLQESVRENRWIYAVGD